MRAGQCAVDVSKSLHSTHISPNSFPNRAVGTIMTVIVKVVHVDLGDVARSVKFSTMNR